LDDIGRVLERFAPTEVKVARTAEERDQLWLARRSAVQPSGARAPMNMALDVSVPAFAAARGNRGITRSAAAWPARDHFRHAGDGNLHPGLLHDSRGQAKPNGSTAPAVRS